MLSSIPPWEEDEEDVSYGVESLFTIIPIKEIINYIIEQIYVQKKLTSICSKLIFTRLLVKLAMKCTFKFNNRFLKQADGCIMDGSLSVTFSEIYIVKMENEIACHLLSKECRDNYSGRKIGGNTFFNRLNNYHPNIKLTRGRPFMTKKKMTNFLTPLPSAKVNNRSVV